MKRTYDRAEIVILFIHLIFLVQIMLNKDGSYVAISINVTSHYYTTFKYLRLSPCSGFCDYSDNFLYFPHLNTNFVKS
jgi:hypothetical protein